MKSKLESSGRSFYLNFISCLPTYVVKSWESPLAGRFLSGSKPSSLVLAPPANFEAVLSALNAC